MMTASKARVLGLVASFVVVLALFGGSAHAQVDVTPPLTQVAFLHAYSGAPNVDVLVNGALLASNVLYGSFSTPLYKGFILSGYNWVNVTFTGTGTSVVSQQLLFDAGNDYTITLEGRTDSPDFPPGLLLSEDTSVNRCPIPVSSYRIRACHVTPGAIVVDVAATITNTDGFFYIAKGLAYGECSDESVVPANAYSFIALTNGVSVYTPVTNTTSTFLLQANHAYSVYFIGVATQPLTPFRFVAESNQPCAAPVNFQPVPAPELPNAPSAGQNQFVPFAPGNFGPDVAPFQPRLRPKPMPTVSIIKGPRAPIIFAAASHATPTLAGVLLATLIALYWCF